MSITPNPLTSSQGKDQNMGHFSAINPLLPDQLSAIINIRVSVTEFMACPERDSVAFVLVGIESRHFTNVSAPARARRRSRIRGSMPSPMLLTPKERMPTHSRYRPQICGFLKENAETPLYGYAQRSIQPIWCNSGMPSYNYMAENGLPFAKVFGERIRQRRNELGFSQGLLFEKTGISAAYISSVERGMANPSLDIHGAAMRRLGMQHC